MILGELLCSLIKDSKYVIFLLVFDFILDHFDELIEDTAFSIWAVTINTAQDLQVLKAIIITLDRLIIWAVPPDVLYFNQYLLLLCQQKVPEIEDGREPIRQLQANKPHDITQI